MHEHHGLGEEQHIRLHAWPPPKPRCHTTYYLQGLKPYRQIISRVCDLTCGVPGHALKIKVKSVRNTRTSEMVTLDRLLRSIINESFLVYQVMHLPATALPCHALQVPNMLVDVMLQSQNVIDRRIMGKAVISEDKMGKKRFKS